MVVSCITDEHQASSLLVYHFVAKCVDMLTLYTSFECCSCVLHYYTTTGQLVASGGNQEGLVSLVVERARLGGVPVQINTIGQQSVNHGTINHHNHAAPSPALTKEQVQAMLDNQQQAAMEHVNQSCAVVVQEVAGRPQEEVLEKMPSTVKKKGRGPPSSARHVPMGEGGQVNSLSPTSQIVPEVMRSPAQEETISTHSTPDADQQVPMKRKKTPPNSILKKRVSWAPTASLGTPRSLFSVRADPGESRMMKLVLLFVFSLVRPSDMVLDDTASYLFFSLFLF